MAYDGDGVTVGSVCVRASTAAMACEARSQSPCRVDGVEVV